MTLARSIVIVNEFSLKTPNGGTRGGTPGAYVLRYMARKGAGEVQGPALRENIDSYVTKYMVREGAAEAAPNRETAERGVRDAGGLGGMAFSKDSLGLSDADLRGLSRSIQDAFDNGKTVLKTVLSFDREYLERTGVLPPGFCEEHPVPRRGDMRGQVDQIRLRQAIRDGLRRLDGDYDDLRWVGTIQVDTAHVHCHLAMADFGTGNLMPDGTQRGKITASQKAAVRRGLDLSLDESRHVQRMASASFLEQRSVRTALVRHTYGQVSLYGAPQRLMSALPEDDRLWRARSNRKEMREANALCRGYVETVLARQDAPAVRAGEAIAAYARARRQREGLTDAEERRIREEARERMVCSCMDGVYGQLRAIPKARRHDPTELLALAADPEPFPDFQGGARDMIYRMGAYGTRLRRHRREARRMDRLCRDYETEAEKGRAAPGSEALYRFFLVDREYHGKVAEKYSRFLFTKPADDSLVEDLLWLEQEARRLDALERMTGDKSLALMGADEAEQYGRETYGAYGGRLAVLDPGALEERLDRLRANYERDRGRFTTTAAARGLWPETDENGNTVLRPARFYRFDDVRALDLHDLRGDFQGPLEYDGKAQADFLSMARRRVGAFDAAAAYLDATGQADLRQALDEEDVEAQRAVVDLVEAGMPVPPVAVRAYEPNRKKTLRLDAELHGALSWEIERRAAEAAASLNTEEDRQAGE